MWALLLLHLAAASALSVAPPPRRGEVGYKRHRAREAVRQILKDLRGRKVPDLPPVLDEQARLQERSVEQAVEVPLPSDAHNMGPVGGEPWGKGVPREIEPQCRAICTEWEEEALLAVKRAVAPWMPRREDADYREPLHGDIRLLRFLRKHGTPTDAADAYRGMLEWRGRVGIDSALRVEPKMNNTSFKNHNQLYQFMPVDLDLHWPDSPHAGEQDSERLEGLMKMRLGDWDTHALVNAVQEGVISERDFMEYWVQVNELISLSLDSLSRQHGKLMCFRIVCDFESSSWRQFSKPFLELIKLWAKTAEFFPCSSREILFMNTPFFFNVLWQFIQPVLTEDTKAKIWLVPREGQAVRAPGVA